MDRACSSASDGPRRSDHGRWPRKRIACALRVNPDVDARTHEKISTGKAENKFGVPLDRAAEIYTALAAEPGLAMRGVAVHIGSQLTSLQPLEDAFVKLTAEGEV